MTLNSGKFSPWNGTVESIELQVLCNSLQFLLKIYDIKISILIPLPLNDDFLLLYLPFYCLPPNLLKPKTSVILNCIGQRHTRFKEEITDKVHSFYVYIIYTPR